MPRRNAMATLACLGVSWIACVAFAQQPAPRDYPEDHRPPLFLRESWKDPFVTDGGKEPGVSLVHVERAILELKLVIPPNM